MRSKAPRSPLWSTTESVITSNDVVAPTSDGLVKVILEKLGDGSVLRLYENIGQQVATDISNGRYHFLGEAAKQRLRAFAEKSIAEISRRDWPGRPSAFEDLVKAMCMVTQITPRFPISRMTITA